MDLRTGQTYETLEQALAAGVPTSDIAHVEQRGDTVHVTVQPTSKYVPHQGKREMARRAKRLAAK